MKSKDKVVLVACSSKEIALAGADVATIPLEVLEQMMNNELTNVSLDGFLKQWYELDEEKRNYFN